jgi:CheY-like chemotaxis protein
MAPRNLHLEESEDIRRVFQRVCRSGGGLRLKFGQFEQEFPLLAEEQDRITVGITDMERGQWDLKSGARVLMRVEDRGRKFEAVVEFSAHGRLEGVECCHFGSPRMLKCIDERRMADFLPERPLPCTFTTHTLDIRDGLIRAFGNEGVELAPRPGEPARGETLRLGSGTVVECSLDKETKLVLPSVVDHFGEGYTGLRFKDECDPQALRTYRGWLGEMLRSQSQRDKQDFDPKGVRTRSKEEAEAARPGSQARILLAHDPMLLVIAEGDAFPSRIVESLGRKFGVASLDYVKGLVRPTLEGLGPGDWGSVKLILVHQRLRVGSGLELTHQMVESEGCMLPILVAGIEDDVALKRNRAIAAGAVDFISVDPFHVLLVMRAIEDTLKMFG